MDLNVYEMIVLVVAIIGVASVLKARYGIYEDSEGNEYHVNSGQAEQLRDEVKALKERLAVLERIATDEGHRLEREIEQLRDQRTA